MLRKNLSDKDLENKVKKYLFFQNLEKTLFVFTVHE